MNDQMWNNPATQRNLSKLKLDGIKIMEPAVGVLAEGYSAKGRMPELKNILLWIGKQIRRAKKISEQKDNCNCRWNFRSN